MEALKVNKSIIGKQEKLFENYNSFINIAKKKKIEKEAEIMEQEEAEQIANQEEMDEEFELELKPN